MFAVTDNIDLAEWCEGWRRIIGDWPAPECGCDCPCRCPPRPSMPAMCSQRPVRYANGELAYRAVDLKAEGFGAEWGHTRTYSNRLPANSNSGSGANWLVKEWPYLTIDLITVAIVSAATKTLFFTEYNGRLLAQFQQPRNAGAGCRQ
ncbi:MAG: hypothetical protein L0215_19245 [Gemmataceae bacterium]|nr:hypothetical protein [Gemmataceae bacterium]